LWQLFFSADRLQGYGTSSDSPDGVLHPYEKVSDLPDDLLQQTANFRETPTVSCSLQQQIGSIRQVPAGLRFIFVHGEWFSLMIGYFKNM
jgi:hypothetical protein